jgi:mannose/cellobiose epimerase-like protein (N-acyl-D-glucosamine 2-epimerase family)
MATSVSIDLSATVQTLRQHLNDVILPLWVGPGFNEGIGLPYEAISAEGVALPVKRYRAMACARQLYVYSVADDAKYAAHADRLFDSLIHYFRHDVYGGWRYSVDAEGLPLDDSQDLYTHAFVVFACAAYFARSHRAEARQVMLQTAEQIEARFRRQDGNYDAKLSADWGQVIDGPAQNPIMHLTEAYIAASGVAEPAWFAQTLRRIAQQVATSFLDVPTQCVAELPIGHPDNQIEPGHQFEWFVILNSAAAVFADVELSLALPRGCEWAREKGVSPDTAGVCAANDHHGEIRDSTQRIWAQAEYARYLAVSGDLTGLAHQLLQFRSRFLHSGGWYESLDAHGQVVRAEMPSTTPYHLMTCYRSLYDFSF